MSLPFFSRKTCPNIRPAEKPKPVPPPPAPVQEPEVAPETTSDEPVAQDEEEVPAEVTQDMPEEPVEAFGDAPAQEEIEQQADAIPEAEPETYANGHAEEVLAEETQQEESGWDVDPAIAGSGSAPQWSQPESEEPAAPEPVTTYTGPPGFNTTPSSKGPVAQAQIQAGPRSSSRAAQRFKTADGQGVVLPPAMQQSLSSMEVQFGSLSFGGLNGDGVEAPTQDAQPETPAQAPSSISPIVSPRRAQQPPAQAPPSQPSPVAQISAPSAPTSAQAAPAQPTPSAGSYPYYGAQAQAQTYQAPHQTLQQQAQAYQQQYLQQHQPAQPPQAPAPETASTQQNQFYRPSEYYNSLGGQSDSQTPQPAQAAQAQTSSPYESHFGFGQSQGYGQVQQAQSTQAQANDYAAAQRVSPRGDTPC